MTHKPSNILSYVYPYGILVYERAKICSQFVFLMFNAFTININILLEYQLNFSPVTRLMIDEHQVEKTHYRIMSFFVFMVISSLI